MRVDRRTAQATMPESANARAYPYVVSTVAQSNSSLARRSCRKATGSLSSECRSRETSDRCGLKDVMDSSCAFCIGFSPPAFVQNVCARSVTDDPLEESDRHDGRCGAIYPRQHCAIWRSRLLECWRCSARRGLHFASGEAFCTTAIECRRSQGDFHRVSTRVRSSAVAARFLLFVR